MALFKLNKIQEKFKFHDFCVFSQILYSLYYRRQDDIVSALEHLEKAQKIAKKHSALKFRGKLYLTKSALNIAVADWEKANLESEAALRYVFKERKKAYSDMYETGEIFGELWEDLVILL